MPGWVVNCMYLLINLYTPCILLLRKQRLGMVMQSLEPEIREDSARFELKKLALASWA